MLEKITINKENGEVLNEDFITCFKINIGGNDHIYYLTTNNEVDPNGLYKIKVSEMIDGKLHYIVSDTEWAEVKNVMRAIISSSNGNYNYVEKNSSVLANNDYGRIIAVQSPAKDKMGQDYKDKLPQVVINNIVNEPEKMVNSETNYNNFEVKEGESVIAPGIVEKQSDEVPKNDNIHDNTVIDTNSSIENTMISDKNSDDSKELNTSSINQENSSSIENITNKTDISNVMAEVKAAIMDKFEQMVDNILKDVENKLNNKE